MKLSNFFWSNPTIILILPVLCGTAAGILAASLTYIGLKYLVGALQ